MSDKEYIKYLKQENDELKKRVEELERLIKQNSKNSSKPPSSDFGRNSKPIKKKTRKRTPINMPIADMAMPGTAKKRNGR